MSDDGYNYVRDHYPVEVAEGQRVAVDGIAGTVVRGTGDQYLYVRFDTGFTLPAHPTWRVDYDPPPRDA